MEECYFTHFSVLLMIHTVLRQLLFRYLLS